MSERFGGQEYSYYTSKTELLNWVNGVLQLQLTRLEQFASGALYCQIIDAYFSNTIPMHKVNFFAREEYESILNYKVLQSGFNSLKITREIDISRLSKGSAVDNLELLQWLYRYLRKKTPQIDYQPRERRALSMRGGTDILPVPTAVANSFDIYGRTDSMLRTSGSSWSVLLESPGSARRSYGVPPSPGRSFSARMSPFVSRPGSASKSRDQDNSITSGYQEVSRKETSIACVQTDFPTEEVGMSASDRSPTRPTGPTYNDAGSATEPGFEPVPSSAADSGTQTFPGRHTSEFSTQTSTTSETLGNGLNDLAAGPDYSTQTAAEQRDVDSGTQTAGNEDEDSVAKTAGNHGDDSRTQTAGSEGAVIRSAATGEAQVGSQNAADEGSANGCTTAGSVSEDSGTQTAGSLGENSGTQTSVGQEISGDAVSTSADLRNSPTGTEPELSAGKSPFAGQDEVLVSAGLDNSPEGATDRLTLESDASVESEALVQSSSTVVNGLTTSSAAVAAADVNAVVTTTATGTSPMLSPRSSLPSPRLPSPKANGLPNYSAAGALTSSVETATQAMSVLQQSLPSLRKLVEMTGNDSDSYIYRGKLRSLRDAVQTLMRHTSLLLGDLQTHCVQKNDTECARAIEDVMKLQQVMGDMETEFVELTAFVDAHESAVTQSSSQPLGPSSPQLQRMTEEQKALSSTQPLDSTLKAVSSAQFALVQHIHRESTAMTAQYLSGVPEQTGSGRESEGGLNQSPGSDRGIAGALQPSTSGRSFKSPHSSTRVFKLGDFQLKRLRNGDIYKGKYINNKKNGEGIYQFINHDVYEGEFKDDRMDGYGVYTFSHEGRYEGEWHNAVYEGAGTETFAKGSTYHGEYSGGLRNGWGVCRFYNGDYYEGQWLKGLRDGRGMQQCTDDSNYVGDYVKGKRHGYGVYSFPNGDRYIGEYNEDLPHGYGVYLFTSGQRYEGEWLRGKKHGWSMYTIENGNKFVGQWQEGKPQWVQPLVGDMLTAEQLADCADDQVRDTMTNASDAYKRANEASDIANLRAVEHWNLQDCIQRSIREAVARAELAATRAQSARQKARELAAKLDSAVALLEDSIKSTDVSVVTD